MNILAIGAHPDDIEIGCGGTLVKYSKKGHNISLLVFTKGESGAKFKVREREQKKVAEYIGAKKVFWGGFTDTKIPIGKESIAVIENAIDKCKPDMVLFNYFRDIHQDHRALSSVSISATRYIKNVLMYEVPTTQEFYPDIFVDIGDTIKDKMKLLKLHTSQVDRTRVPYLTILDSAKASATFRGFQGRFKYAEGFKSLRMTLEI